MHSGKIDYETTLPLTPERERDVQKWVRRRERPLFSHHADPKTEHSFQMFMFQMAQRICPSIAGQALMRQVQFESQNQYATPSLCLKYSTVPTACYRLCFRRTKMFNSMKNAE